MASSAAGGGPDGRGDDAGRPLAPPWGGSNPPDIAWQYRYGRPDTDGSGGSSRLPVPYWFNEDSARRFRDMDVRDDDIVVSSGGEMAVFASCALFVFVYSGSN